MASRMLDYERPARGIQRNPPPTNSAANLPVDTNWTHPSSSPALNTGPEKLETHAFPKIPRDYPTVETWLRTCEDDIERGRDKHAYLSLLPVFSANGCTRLDDITRVSAEQLRALASAQGIDATIGLTNRIHAYAVEDVARLKAAGRNIF